MPIFTFEGFTEGSLVAMSAAQGTQGAQGSVPEWRLSNMNTATLDILQITPAELVAPVGIWFEATDIQGFAVSENTSDRGYDPAAHEITYIWDFGDPGTFGPHLNLPTAWNNSGVDYGKQAYHVFDTPGTYAVRLWAVDREGTTGERMISVTVRDPGDVYPSTSTICVSNQGDFTGAPAGAQLLGSLAAAQTAYRNLGRPGRLLLRRGETFQEPEYVINGQQQNHRIGAFGDAADPRPILRRLAPNAGQTFGGNIFAYAPRSTGVNLTHSVFYDLDMQGDWDATKETGDPRQGNISYLGHNEGVWHVLHYRCKFDGFSGLEPYTNDPDANYTSAFVDCEITNWRSQGMFFGLDGYDPDNRLCLVGTSIMQPENVCKGQGLTSGLYTEGLSNKYGAIRHAYTQTVLVSASSFYTGTGPDPTTQSAMRMCTSNDAAPATAGYYLGMNRLVAEGGQTIINIHGQNSGADSFPGNQIVDMALLVASYGTQRWIGFAHGGTTARNVLFVEPTVTKQNSPLQFILGFNHPDQNGNADAPVRFYSNTFLNQNGGSAITQLVNSDDKFTDLVSQNNVDHQPSAGITTFAPVDLTQSIVGFAPRNRGIRLGPEKVSTSVSGVGQNGTFTVGYPSGTGPADFSPGGRHTVKIGDAYWFSHHGHISLAFGASNITVTNLSTVTMTGTAQLGLDQDTLTTDATYASPATVPLAVPQVGSAALTDEGGLQAHTQFDTGQRVRPEGAV